MDPGVRAWGTPEGWGEGGGLDPGIKAQGIPNGWRVVSGPGTPLGAGEGLVEGQTPEEVPQAWYGVGGVTRGWDGAQLWAAPLNREGV